MNCEPTGQASNSIHRKPPTRINRLPTHPPTLPARQKRHNLTDIIQRPNALLHRRHRRLRLDQRRRDRLQHVRVHGPRRHRIDRRAITTQLRRPAARQPLQRSFATTIQTQFGKTAAGADAGHVDDASRAAEVREDGLGQEDGRADVEVVRLFVVGEGY